MVASIVPRVNRFQEIFPSPLNPRTWAGEAEAAAVAHQDWTFITNHGHVLLCLSQQPELRMRDIAEKVGITERAVQRIILDLSEAGYIEREKTGRRNRYLVRTELPLRHAVESHRCVGDLIAMVVGIES